MRRFEVEVEWRDPAMAKTRHLVVLDAETRTAAIDQVRARCFGSFFFLLPSTLRPSRRPIGVYDLVGALRTAQPATSPIGGA